MRTKDCNLLLLLFILILQYAILSCSGHVQKENSNDPCKLVIDSLSRIPNAPFTLIIKSEILNENRRIYIQLPEDYGRDNKKYPLLVILDGEWLFNLANAHQRYYSYDEVTDIKIPRMIVVGIENTDRDRDYVPTSNSGNDLKFPTAGGADKFLDFVEKELLPVIERKYRVAPHRCLVGWSFSGLFTTYTAISRPELFNMYLCISPAIWWDGDLVYNKIKYVNFNQHEKIVFTLGTKEKGGMVYSSTKRLIDELLINPKKNLDIELIKVQNVGHSWGVATALNLGLQFLYQEYIPEDNLLTENEMYLYYNKISKQWGYSVIPPGKVFINVAYNIWASGKSEEAISLLKKGVKFHRNDSQLCFFLGQMLNAAGRTEEALSFYEKALMVEKSKYVPNIGSLKEFNKVIESVKKSMVDSI